MPPKEIPDELIDQLLAGREGPEAITGPDGLLKQLTKRVVERAVSAELSGHLGYELGEEPPEGRPNRPNGLTSKTLITEHLEGFTRVSNHDEHRALSPQLQRLRDPE
jgi:putative transposase